jgi:hypothetical protein
MRAAREGYLACVADAADRSIKSAASAEDIALAAHGRCWRQWDGYRESTFRSFAARAATREERQLARDKAEAHLREFERDTRRSIAERIIESNLSSR